MKVLVAGGAGYIGSHAVYELLRAGHDVVVFDNLSTGRRSAVPNAAQFVQGDIRNINDLNAVFKEQAAQESGPIDVAMHFAAKLIVPESVTEPLAYYDNNVCGLRTMLESMVQNDIKNVVFSSTAAVYGEPDKPICHEDDNNLPINPYGETKLACERMIKWVAAAHDMNYAIFRYFNVAGADESLTIGLDKDQLTHLIPLIMQTALGLRDKLSIFGNDYETPDGTCIRDYIHVTDLAQAHVLGAEYITGMPGTSIGYSAAYSIWADDNNNNDSDTSNGTCGGDSDKTDDKTGGSGGANVGSGKTATSKTKGRSIIANLGSGKGYSVAEVVNAAKQMFDFDFEYAPRRPGDPAKLTADITRAREQLGWEPQLSLEEMLKSDYDYRKKLAQQK
ncbi:MAG: UDP-glucose 4-epimerase GalE [Coriobacteriales bacterium]|jgi:UDP-glucose 4-epimerase|nr:UDP-glucose 4-epimerase GalE [Coriobacteriales bacterium]